MAIANPSSGPGDELNLEYAAVFTEAAMPASRWWVALSTDFGKAPSRAEIEKDVDAWIRFFTRRFRVFLRSAASGKGHGEANFAELRIL